jgi:hypothetical protein
MQVGVAPMLPPAAFKDARAHAEVQDWLTNRANSSDAAKFAALASAMQVSGCGVCSQHCWDSTPALHPVRCQVGTDSCASRRARANKWPC